MQSRMLSARALNRALLARQLLLARQPMTVAGALEHLCGLQAQEPQAPYVALWTRLEQFAPEELSRAIASRAAVRAPLMRATIHLVTARDWGRLRPHMKLVLERRFKSSAFMRALDGVELERLLARGEQLLAERPLSRAELGPILAAEWPNADPEALAYAISYLAGLVQVPPRGLWRRSGAARWTTAEAWLSDRTNAPGSVGDLVLRYLAAYGPATVQDIQAWCGLTRLRDVVAEQRDRLRVLADERGRELFDIPDGQLPDPRTPAPPRFLAPFDNAVLSHHDRGRIVEGDYRQRVYRDRLMRTFLLDGFVAGTWELQHETFHIHPIRPLADKERAALADEAQRLLTFLLPDAPGRQLRFSDATPAGRTRRTA